jgi:MarR family transcriptional regulator, organic hydroperoxide resistance regulator
MSAGRPEVSPGFLLWRATLRWQREIVAALRPYDLTHVQFVLLVSTWWLGENGDQPPSQAQVAAHAAADVMMTSSVLRTLERRGLVTRSPDPADARVKRLAVTEAGRRLALETVAVVEAADAAFFARAGSGQQALEVLSRLAAPEEGSR